MSNEDKKLDEILTKLDNIEKRLDKADKNIKQGRKNVSKTVEKNNKFVGDMYQYISFVERIYVTLSKPIEYIMTPITYFTGSELPQLPEERMIELKLEQMPKIKE